MRKIECLFYKIGVCIAHVELQKLRFGSTAIINCNIQTTLSDGLIAPLILITFIENAFKHGVNPEEKSIIDVEIKLKESKLFLYIKNKKVNNFTKSEQGTFVGIENAKTRLRLLYPNKHNLKITENETDFVVQLIIEFV